MCALPMVPPHISRGARRELLARLGLAAREDSAGELRVGISVGRPPEGTVVCGMDQAWA